MMGVSSVLLNQSFLPCFFQINWMYQNFKYQSFTLESSRKVLFDKKKLCKNL